MIRIGIDVGGTNTDAVVMDGDQGSRRRQGADDAGRDVGRRGGAEVRARGLRAEARGDRRRHDRHDAFHQRGRAAPRSRADRRRPARPAGDRLAAADGRLARGPQERDRQSRLSRSRRPRVRRPRDFSARRSRAARHRRGHQGQGHPLGRDRLGVQPGQHGVAKPRPARFSRRRCPACMSRCRATSAASACSSARTRRS